MDLELFKARILDEHQKAIESKQELEQQQQQQQVPADEAPEERAVPEKTGGGKLVQGPVANGTVLNATVDDGVGVNATGANSDAAGPPDHAASVVSGSVPADVPSEPKAEASPAAQTLPEKAVKGSDASEATPASGADEADVADDLRAAAKAKSKASAEDELYMFNYAAASAGAKILGKSDGMKSAHTLLLGDVDKYMMAPCKQRKWFIVQLSEDIMLQRIAVANYEHYSSGLKDFQVLGSDTHPTDKWLLLGQFRARNVNDRQVFDISKPVWVRYLKFRLLSHYGSEYYCTLTYAHAYGGTMLDSFRQVCCLSCAPL